MEIFMATSPNQNLDANAERADFGSRFVGSIIDLLLSVVVPFFVLGLIGPFLPGILGAVWVPGVAISVVIYSAITGMRGYSPGLKAGNLALIDARTGRPPGVVRSLLLGIERLIGAAAGAGTVMTAFSDPGPSSTRNLDVAIGRTCLVLLAISVLGRLWMLFDRDHATLFDRLLGLAVVRKTSLGDPAPLPRD
jgi:uncharacterized RDD family membrane protein YckC